MIQIMSVPEEAEIRSAEPTALSSSSAITPCARSPIRLSPQPVGPTQTPILPKGSEGAKIASVSESSEAPTTPAAAKTSMRSIWYLGGNHVIKLLTSVDGDLDPDVLAKIAAVPPVIGDLALSVESLVSDDFTVGGFENDLLAKIASNTLAGRQSFSLHNDSPTGVVASSPEISRPESPAAPAGTTQQESSVPNPLESYQPVPNPLARITPPGSPVPCPLEMDNKRKDVSERSASPNTKRRKITAPIIQAR